MEIWLKHSPDGKLLERRHYFLSFCLQLLAQCLLVSSKYSVNKFLWNPARIQSYSLELPLVKYKGPIIEIWPAQWGHLSNPLPHTLNSFWNSTPLLHEPWKDTAQMKALKERVHWLEKQTLWCLKAKNREQRFFTFCYFTKWINTKHRRDCSVFRVSPLLPQTSTVERLDFQLHLSVENNKKDNRAPVRNYKTLN